MKLLNALALACFRTFLVVFMTHNGRFPEFRAFGSLHPPHPRTPPP